MTFIHGKNARLWFDAYDLSQYFSECGISSKSDTAETTTFTATGKTYVVALQDATASLKGLFDGDAAAVDEVLDGIFASETTSVFTFAPQGSGAIGNATSQMAVYATEYQVTTPVNDVVSTTASLQGNQGVFRGVLLAANTSVSATGNGTGVDNSALSSNGGFAHLHVTSNTRNGTVTVKVQHSVDNSTFADLATFTAIGATTIGKERLTVAAGTTVNRYLRYQVTLGGSTGSAVLTVAFARR